MLKMTKHQWIGVCQLAGHRQRGERCASRTDQAAHRVRHRSEEQLAAHREARHQQTPAGYTIEGTRFTGSDQRATRAGAIDMRHRAATA